MEESLLKAEWDIVFRKRMEAHFDEMKWLYGELYHNDSRAFSYFCTTLYQYYQSRSGELKALDRKRLEKPDWYKDNDMLGMLMYTSAFAETLQGVKKHIAYLQECGVNYVHLMPLLQSPKGRSDGGYAVSDFRTVQPELGTMEDLTELSAECHRRGMSVCLDFVMNHTSEDHEWARRARAGEKEFQDRYFFFDNWNIPKQFEETVPQVFPQTAPGNFSWCEETGKVVMTTFYPYQWDLNYANPTVFNDMTANMLYLCNQGVDIIRLDAVPYIWKRLRTNCRNLPEVHTLVRLMRMAVEVVCPGTLLLGEVVMEPSRVVPYFGTLDKPECYMLYNVTTMASTWHTVATRDVRLLKHQLEAVFALPHQYTFLNYLRCHDDIGWGLDYDFLGQFGTDQVKHKKFLNDYLTGKWWGSDSRGELYNDDPRLGDARLCGTTASLCGIDAAECEKNSWKLDHSIRLDIMLHAFLLVQSGIPVLYSGDEIGQLNDYSYHEDPLKASDSRYLHRGNLNWKEVAERKKTDSRPGRIFRALRKLEKLRAEHDLFKTDADTWTLETMNDHILGIGRYYHEEKLLALFNFSEEEQTARTGEREEYINLLTGKKCSADDVTLQGHDFIWLYHTYQKQTEKKNKRRTLR
ncbi:MAG: alpha-amylase family protein [Butyrivibrio sp.]|jgi:amylosucrase|nr:alpha-amylase family protein [Butyrivibrio sp.]